MLSGSPDNGGAAMKNNVAVLREAAEMTQSELAEAVGISRPYLSDIERDVSEPTIGIARRICLALRKSFEEVFPGRPGAGTKEASSNG